jgi:predicted Rossmann fold flavoprotein
MYVVIVGAGASGCFCAVNLKRRLPDADVTIIEKGSKPMAKLAVTGGGRCNLTNSFEEIKSIKKVYPRGDKLMKRALKAFSNNDTMAWFETEGVKLITQSDQCVFPKSQDAMEIVNTLQRLMSRLGVKILTRTSVESIEQNDDFSFTVTTSSQQKITAQKVVVTAGGKPKEQGFSFLKPLSIDIIPPVPSLFTLNVNDESLQNLMGTVVNGVTVRLIGTNYSTQGALLITHWGLSGPAVLKLSSLAARHLAECNYSAEVGINWLETLKESEALQLLSAVREQNPQKQIGSFAPSFDLPQNTDTHRQSPVTHQLWLYIIYKVGLSPQKRWQEMGAKQMNRLASVLTNDIHQVSGKGKFKEEFVTCGGVALSEIDFNTMESKKHKGLFFAGEILDIDAVTGGFNLQAAWTTSYIAAQNI